MRYGSVCSGIESASLAWEPMGWKASWFAEIEPFPSAVLAHHWPDVENLGDMTTIAERVRNGEIEAPDILVGGTPCQAFSVAGMRGGLSDARGQLTLSYVDLANAIDTRRSILGQQPCITVWENVPGVLSSKDNAFGCFLGALAGEDGPVIPAGKKWTNAGCVFGPQRAVAWRVIDAQYFGVAQRRRRVFVVASAREGFDPAAVLFESEGLRRDIAPSREAGQEIAGTLESRTGAVGFRMAAFGEYSDDGTASTMKARDYKDATDLAVSVALRGREGGATAELGGPVAGTLRASSGGGDKPHVMTVHGTQDPCVSDSTAFALGRNNGGENAVYAPAYGIPGNWIGRKPENGGNSTEPMHDLAPCQTVADRHGVAHGLAVRRLTPTECERLQGFPDGWTDVPYRNKPAADSPRYKAIGNSKAVPCIRWIGERILTNLNAS